MEQQISQLSNFSFGILIIFGILFLTIAAGLTIRWFVLSTKKQMCSMDRDEVSRIAEDRITAAFGVKMRQMKKQERTLKNAADIYKENAPKADA